MKVGRLKIGKGETRNGSGRKSNVRRMQSLGEKQRLKKYREIKSESEGFGSSKGIRACERVKG